MDKFKKAELMKVEFEEETDGYLWFKVRSPSGGFNAYIHIKY